MRARVNERTLLYAGGGLGVVGLLVVLLGWWGASHTINLQEQVPYMISGGLFGLALVFLGGFAYFAYWVTRLVQEQRRQTDALLDALQALRPAEAADAGDPTGVVAANGARSQPQKSHGPPSRARRGRQARLREVPQRNIAPASLQP